MDNNSEVLIIVSSVSQLKKAYKLYNRFCGLGKSALILAVDEVENRDCHYRFRNIKHYQEIIKIDYSELKQSAYNVFYDLAEQAVYPGTTLRQLTTYKGVSLWNLSAHYIFAHLIPLLYDLNIAEAILDIEQPEEIYALDDNGLLENAFRLHCERKRINFSAARITAINVLGIKKTFKGYQALMGRTKKLCVSLYFLVTNSLKSLRTKRKYEVIFFMPLERFFLAMIPVILKYPEGGRLVVKTFFRESSKKLQDNKIFYTELYGYKLYDIFRWPARTFLKKIREEINHSGFYKKVFIKDVFIGDLLSQIFKNLINENFPEKIRDIDLIRKVILAYKPKVVVVGGNSTETMRIVKSLSVPVMALQSIHPADFVFFGPLLADAVTVDGSYWKQYLIAADVAPEKIWITGSPKFDFLQKERPSLPRTNPARKLSQSRKTVIFATNYSSLAMGSLKYQNLERIKNVCEAIRNIKEAHLIIKLHPFDTDFGLYKSIAKGAGLTDYTLKKNVEILNLLQNCDLLITYISAVSYEAVLMDKDVILLSRDNDFQADDCWDFKRYNAAIIVDRFTELEDYIRKSLFDHETKSRLKENRKNYIREHAYKMDGNASHRVKEIIDKFCNN